MRFAIVRAVAMAACWSATSHAGGVHPSPAVGDRWTYEQFNETDASRSSNGLAEFRAAYWTKAEALLVAARYARAGRTLSQDSNQVSRIHALLAKDGCVFSINDGKPLLSGAACEEPLSAGQSWQFRDADPRAQGVYKVTALEHEQVVVPAGSFNAIKLTSLWTRTSKGDNLAAAARTTYWYVPEVKSMVRQERIFLDEGGQEISRVSEVLRSFVAGPPALSP